MTAPLHAPKDNAYPTNFQHSLVRKVKHDYNTNMNIPNEPIPVLEDLPNIPDDFGKSKS